ncbi:DUF1835 domain-containing protein [Chryseobacterium populi]|uniref:DUF1835 domain-containing protein n=1 Tax=Chryseobacterium populi TaxID=1144316 RepID=J2K4P6_9FLAO|nr:DUF1835 domain-containing protein [Chryseobacterium populi]EJL75155.1 hypothetical protein (DUF1835) [Chryseobacterium populi]
MKKTFHIANGDYLAEYLNKTSVGGEIIVCREALISGPLQSDSLDHFWKIRSEFVSGEYEASQQSYYKKVVPEFQKILDIPENAEVNLWFEDDLFCQVNIWFCISLLSEKKNIQVFRVFPQVPDVEDHWKGFSLSGSHALEESYRLKEEFRKEDIRLGAHFWNAYKNQDKNQLSRLSENKSVCFRYLKEVIDAYCNAFPENTSLTNPEVFVKKLTENGVRDFNIIFKEFQQNFGIYGYGDVQVKNMCHKAINR